MKLCLPDDIILHVREFDIYNFIIGGFMKNKLFVICIVLCIFSFFSNIYGTTISISDFKESNDCSSYVGNAKSIEDIDKIMFDSIGLSDNSLIIYILEKVFGFISIFVLSIFCVLLFRFLVTIICKCVFSLIRLRASLIKNKNINDILIGINR